MTRGRKLLLGYALCSALAYATIALPGGPFFEGDGALWWPVLSACVVVLIWRGSTLAWVLAVLFHAFVVLSLVLLTAGFEAEIAALAVLNLAALVLLLSRDVRQFKGRPHTPRPAAG